jgi:signal transduction histidine kinase
MITHVIEDFKSQSDSARIQLTYTLGNNIETDEDNNTIIVVADKSRLIQVISNLLTNAMKFTESKGSISVRSEKIDSHVIVSVNDTGIGIDPEIMPRLFTKFATKSQTSGTGLGLFISKNIIEAHGGIIWAENYTDGTNNGSMFAFRLPLNSHEGNSNGHQTNET